MRDHPAPNSRNIAGHAIGLDWAPRLSSLSLSKAQCIDWHSHNDTEVVVCIKGSLDYEFRSTSPQKLHAGDALVIPPHCVHRLKDGVDGPSRRCSLFLRKRLPTRAGLALFSAAEYQRLMSRILDKRQIPCTIPGRKIYEAQRLADLIDRAPKLSALDVLEIRALVSSAVVTLSSAETVRRQPRSNNIVNEAQHWLLDRLSSKISVNDLVAHIGYGRSRFFALFKSATGLTPVEWLTIQRIEKAKSLLLSESATSADVSRQVGFSSPAFFSKTFKIRTGKTPLEWRQYSSQPG